MEPCLATCANCGELQINKKRLKCSKCKISYYCNKKCQTVHWPQHKHQCKKQSRKKKISNITISEEEHQKIKELHKILNADGILPKTKYQSESIIWDCHGELLNKLSQKYHDHHSLLLSGYLKMIVSTQNAEHKHKNFMLYQCIKLSQHSQQLYCKTFLKRLHSK